MTTPPSNLSLIQTAHWTLLEGLGCLWLVEKGREADLQLCLQHNLPQEAWKLATLVVDLKEKLLRKCEFQSCT